ncbi:MAG: DUF885 domain-containing protein [Blastocatellia bacterium]
MKRTAFFRVLLLMIVVVAPAVEFPQSESSNNFEEPYSRIRPIIETFREDYGILDRFFSATSSAARSEHLRKLYTEYLGKLDSLDYNSLSADEKIDFTLLHSFLNHQIKEQLRADAQKEEMRALIPFIDRINDLEDARRRGDRLDPAKAADALDKLVVEINELRRRLESPQAERPKRTVAYRAVSMLQSLRTVLRNWNGFYAGYDPEFTWWCEVPFKAADDALQKYTTFVSERLVGIRPDDKITIIGDPIGREALIDELRFEMIPYTPEELLRIAEREFEWCQAQLRRASREMGFGDDYLKAIEAVKQKYVEPGKQPELIRKFAREAIEYVKKYDLVSVPKLAENYWRMEMMTPERQLVAPFFLGGETILVAYPTDSMSHEQKLMSLRGNNPHFARAVTHHELIPGHHLQGFINRRFRPYRNLFRTPFSVEGWALYWEFLLWDRGFSKTPEDQIGVLFWRSHRAARIIFSLNFHLGNWTAERCVDLLVNKVGHERDNALAEVRRSFSGEYAPLYQAAYMLGGLQFYALHNEFVKSGRMTDREFHDTILKQGPIPVAMVRYVLSEQAPPKNLQPNWRFYRDEF